SLVRPVPNSTLFPYTTLFRSKLAPGAHERAHSQEYPWDVAKMMAEQGLLGITIPEDSGGVGGTLMDAVVAIQAVAAACPRSADRSEEHTSELQSRFDLVCRLL